MQKEQVISTLKHIATLMELKGENSFKIRAFHNACRALEAETESLDIIVKENRLTNIKGIGEGIAKKIVEMVVDNKSTWLEDLQNEVPKDLVKMLGIPGLGSKKIRTMYKELGISTLQDLKQACLDSKIEVLPKFGKKIQENILSGIETLNKHAGKYLFSFAHIESQKIMAYMRECNCIDKLEIAGSLRRRKEITKDIDMLVVASDSETVMQHFVSYPQVEKIIGHGQKKSSIQLRKGLQVDLRVVEEHQFAFALMYFTGSKEHNTQMRSIAKKRGLKLNEYGLFNDKEESSTCSSEEDVFLSLGLQYVIPELRENLGEIELAQKNELPQLISQQDLKGIFHMHTEYSDGKNTVREMAEKAQEMGYKYIGITDHSQSLTVAGGMKPNEVKKQFAEIDALNEEFDSFRIFKGVESDILADGSLDYDEDLLAQFDFIIGSIHGNFKMSEAEMTKRVITAIENPYLTMIGHPTGRLLLKREPYAINMTEVIHAAAENNVVVEINAHPFRLDLDWRWGKLAAEKNLLTSINPDSHIAEGFDDIYYGIGIARKAWFNAERVINTWKIEQVEKFFAKK
ncbi:DNA polymerase/3'-5' exonuclease PolX [Candidatus Uabimicrobium sp. HlEnr_7]|uniref:DNA polymerase/3'-5' exonuclease PolX n=1 Tax=Candidatus Uabimicrobium helgolandensis TaxID=3095367 RepID=UPI003558AD22